MFSLNVIGWNFGASKAGPPINVRGHGGAWNINKLVDKMVDNELILEASKNYRGFNDEYAPIDYTNHLLYGLYPPGMNLAANISGATDLWQPCEEENLPSLSEQLRALHAEVEDLSPDEIDKKYGMHFVSDHVGSLLNFRYGDSEYRSTSLVPYLRLIAATEQARKNGYPCSIKTRDLNGGEDLECTVKYGGRLSANGVRFVNGSATHAKRWNSLHLPLVKFGLGRFKMDEVRGSFGPSSSSTPKPSSGSKPLPPPPKPPKLR